MSHLVHAGGGCCKTGNCYSPCGKLLLCDVACCSFGDCCLDILAISCGELIASLIQLLLVHVLHVWYLMHFILQLFLHNCEIKSGSALGTRRGTYMVNEIAIKFHLIHAGGCIDHGFYISGLLYAWLSTHFCHQSCYKFQIYCENINVYQIGC